jgi:chromosome segregation ATPase
MKEIEKQIQRIKAKVLKANTAINTLTNDNQDLKGEIKLLKEKLADKDKGIFKLENQLNLAKIAKSISLEKEDAKDIKKIINKYVREIEKCIAHLNE